MLRRGVRSTTAAWCKWACASFVLGALTIGAACSSEDNPSSNSGNSGSSGAGGAGDDAGVDSSTDASADVDTGPMRCNGYEQLCDRKLNEVVFAATHNAMSNAEEDWGAPNQQYGLGHQLADGIRGMLLDVHPFEDDIYLCHQVCQFGKRKLSDALSEIHDFLVANPHEILIFFFEDYVPASDMQAQFKAAKLEDMTLEHKHGSPWPTLREMIESNHRVVVFAESEGPPPAWYMHGWDEFSDTPYSFETVDDLNCDLNRGQLENDLFLMNHWLSDPLSRLPLAEEANTYDVLSARANKCKTERKLPNLIAVDFYATGALFDVVNELNGVKDK